MYFYNLQNYPNIFGQPLVCLLSPEQVPTTMQGKFIKIDCIEQNKLTHKRLKEKEVKSCDRDG